MLSPRDARRPVLLPQPSDWTAPGAHEVCPGVYRIPLPLAVDGLHAVNVYVLEAADGLVIVDAGWADAGTRDALAAGLGQLGHGLDDIAEILVTHAHWDHYTHALSLRRELGIRVRLGRGERPSIERFTPEGPAYPEQARQLLRCGAAALAREVAAREATEAEKQVQFGLPDSWLDDGEQLELTGRTLEVLATPGHTRGHVVLRDGDAGLLFAGDHILPHITPSIGLERSPEPRPLHSYLASLRLVRGQPDMLLLPAHGPVSPSTHTRTDELLTHHEQRLDAVLRLVRAGHADAYSVAAALPWTRRRRHLDELDLTNRMLAVLEIQAHLDVLADQGMLLRADSTGDTDRYLTA